MAGWLSTLVGTGVGTIVESAGKVADRFIETDEDRAQFRLQMAEVERVAQDGLLRAAQDQIQARERVLIAELQQGDLFTKRARPSVVYAGLVFIALDHVVFPWIAVLTGQSIPAITLPTEFWVSWSGLVTTWILGRTAEKRGSQSKLVRTVTGAHPARSMLDDHSSGGL